MVKTIRQKLIDNDDKRIKLELEMYDLVDELSLMLDVFNSSIITKVMPQKRSPCHLKIKELLKKAGRKPAARG